MKPTKECLNCAFRVSHQSNLKLIIPILGSLVFHGSAQAQEVYRCVIEHSPGKRETVYSQLPCAQGTGSTSITKKLPSANTYTPESAQDYDEKKAKMADIMSAAEQGNLAEGMTPDQVRQSWGKPTAINYGKGPEGNLDQWVYEDKDGKYTNAYVYFSKGIVHSYTNRRPLD